MSTHLQQYSIANQTDAIERYAEAHSFRIVQQFVDAGRSGLTLKERPALRQLLVEVISGKCAVNHVLVYDVSRWGRFQDADESAYYEYMCRKANVQVHYCVEQFSNDYSVYSSLLKAIKRMMAGEYSRELSVKTFQGASRLARMGYHQGGSPGYGLRRLLVDRSGIAKGNLTLGERKSLHTDRVILAPGPQRECEVIKQIFNAFVVECKSEGEIAQLLNGRKIRPEHSSRWPNAQWTRARVHRVLTSPKYIGTNVYNRKSAKLRQKTTLNPVDRWVCREGAFQQIIQFDQFLKAQEKIRLRQESTADEQILDGLRSLLQRAGKLTATVIAEDEATPSVSDIQRRFNSLVTAYRLIGYKPDRDYKGNGKSHYERVRPVGTRSLADEIIEAVRAGRLSKTFDIAGIRTACPGWARSTYTTFVGHHATGRGRSPVKLVRVGRGMYRLNELNHPGGAPVSLTTPSSA
jgi:DNA invertase Pin-like site-specific DNA recombinase